MRISGNPKLWASSSILITSGFFYLLTVASLNYVPRAISIGFLIPLFVAMILQVSGLLDEARRRKLPGSTTKVGVTESR